MIETEQKTSNKSHVFFKSGVRLIIILPITLLISPPSTQDQLMKLMAGNKISLHHRGGCNVKVPTLKKTFSKNNHKG